MEDDPWDCMERMASRESAVSAPVCLALGVGASVTENLSWLLFGYEPAAERYTSDSLWDYDTETNGLTSKVEDMLAPWKAHRNKLGGDFLSCPQVRTRLAM